MESTVSARGLRPGRCAVLGGGVVRGDRQYTESSGAGGHHSEELWNGEERGALCIWTGPGKWYLWLHGCYGRGHRHTKAQVGRGFEQKPEGLVPWAGVRHTVVATLGPILPS